MVRILVTLDDDTLTAFFLDAISRAVAGGRAGKGGPLALNGKVVGAYEIKKVRRKVRRRASSRGPGT